MVENIQHHRAILVYTSFKKSRLQTYLPISSNRLPIVTHHHCITLCHIIRSKFNLNKYLIKCWCNSKYICAQYTSVKRLGEYWMFVLRDIAPRNILPYFWNTHIIPINTHIYIFCSGTTFIYIVIYFCYWSDINYKF